MYTFTFVFFPAIWMAGWKSGMSYTYSGTDKNTNQNKTMETRRSLNDTLWVVKWKTRFLLQSFSNLVESVTLDWLYHWQQFTLTRALHFTGNMSTTSCSTSPMKANAWGVPSRKLYGPQKHSQLPSTLLKYLSAFLHF